MSICQWYEFPGLPANVGLCIGTNNPKVFEPRESGAQTKEKVEQRQKAEAKGTRGTSGGKKVDGYKSKMQGDHDQTEGCPEPQTQFNTIQILIAEMCRDTINSYNYKDEGI